MRTWTNGHRSKRKSVTCHRQTSLELFRPDLVSVLRQRFGKFLHLAIHRHAAEIHGFGNVIRWGFILDREGL